VTWAVACALAADFGWENYPDAEAPEYDNSEFQALVETLGEETNWDGYALAKHLEDVYDMPMDAEAVNTLDAAYMYQSKTHDALVKQWVLDTQAVPKYAVDAVVRIARDGPGEELVGVVKTVQAAVLRYSVYVQEHAEESRKGKYIATIYNEEQILGLKQ
jgi:hypothetical protein